eukprot:TRINITY_DN20787_c0_g1_i1.p1 TRINITY_DN20787_c0_g1~~TRINITY_DN20787_c0_g1_i1.p1  ORF type:complete len:365 (+),score=56.05 TRINITY_DN20787_c0_g1_i1:61-1095(+)
MSSTAPVIKEGREETKNGAYSRTASVFRNRVAAGTEFPPASGRYHLYVSYACPWASRCIAMRNLKGLEDAIPMSVVHPCFLKTKPEVDNHLGWAFVKQSEGPYIPNVLGKGKITTRMCTGDLVNDYKTVRELYEKSSDSPVTKFTVPILFDTETNKIVNNESSEIVEMLNFDFNDFAKNPNLNLYPDDKLKEINELNDAMYESINNGVYKCGFAQAQEPYDEALDALFAALDVMEDRLSTHRYLCGDVLTIADIRLFVTLVRFDHVYYVHFKTSKKLLREYPNLFAYTRELYQMPGIRESVDMEHIVTHYLTSHTVINPYAIIPSCTTDFELPHNREMVGIESP